MFKKLSLFYSLMILVSSVSHAMFSEEGVRDDKNPPLSSRRDGEVAVASPTAMHSTEKEYLLEYLKRGESLASPMLYLTSIIGMREQTTVFDTGNDYFHQYSSSSAHGCYGNSLGKYTNRKTNSIL